MRISPRVSRVSLAFGILAIVLLVLVSTRPTHAQGVLAPAFSLARGTVVDTRDPQAAGRIKVQFPWLPEVGPVWARILLPVGEQPHLGVGLLPGVGDEVVVGFDQGDPRNPIILGTLWNGGRPPTSGR